MNTNPDGTEVYGSDGRPLRRYTVDMIVTAITATGERVFLVAVKSKEPFLGRYVIPGGHVNHDETGLQAAFRELKEETSLEPKHGEKPVLIAVEDYPGLDPRGPVVNITYALSCTQPWPISGEAGEASAAWVPWETLKREGMGYDHVQRITAALSELFPSSTGDH